MLGIETSCDETAVAVVGADRTIHANLVLSQLEEHKVFGGVVPEIAARAHLDHLDTLIAAALSDAGIGFDDLAGVAATSGPGLIGGVMVGMMAGKAIAAARNLPFIGVNHLEAHVLTARLTDETLDFPYLVLLVSGGHTQLLVAEAVGRYRQLGTTIDDALGECFDKAAKLMGLGYPGGPNLEKIAATCADPAAARARFALPTPLKGRPGSDFSFSGLKTAVRAHVDALPPGDFAATDIAALASAFQDTVCDILSDRCAAALTRFKRDYADHIAGGHKPAFVICGGVAANKTLRTALKNLTINHNMAFSAPPGGLCSDNGAMIAWTGIERLQNNMTDTLDLAARPRWPLDQTATSDAAKAASGT